MLTIYYVAATWLQSWRLSSTLSKIKDVRRKNGSIALHQEIPPYIYMVRSASMQSKIEVNGVLSKSCSNHNISNIKDLIWYASNKKILSIFPQQELDISGWISVIPGRTHLPIQFEGQSPRLDQNRILLLLEADYHTCQYHSDFVILQIEKFGVPLAWHVRENMSILMETDENKLAALLVTFMLSSSTLENGIQVVRLITVGVTGTPYKIQNVQSVPKTYAPLDSGSPLAKGGLGWQERKERFMSRWRAHISMLATFSEAIEQVKDAQEEISVRHPGSGVGAVRLVPNLGLEDYSDVRAEAASVIDTLEVEAEVAREDEDSDEGASEGGSSVATPTHPTFPVGPSTPSSTHDSISRISTDTVIPPDSTRMSGEFSVTTSVSSLRSVPSTPRRTTISSPALSSSASKPPNIVIFSDSSSAAESVHTALELILTKDRYTVHSVGCGGLAGEAWRSEGGARLAIVHGDVPVPLSSHIIKFLSETPDGAAFCLCSDLLGIIVPLFRTAEVRPNELVRCSYKTWKHVPLVHHVFCYQPSPPSQQFSQDDHSRVVPSSMELVDEAGRKHQLRLEVLAVEETWRTPSLLLVTFTQTNAKIIFSQVQLEVDPEVHACDEERRLTLQQSNKARLEILSDVLSNHLGLSCCLPGAKPKLPQYSLAYFLGNHERKQSLLDKLTESGSLDSKSVLTCCDQLSLRFCGKGITPPASTATVLSVLMHSCPETFSTVEYFENLKTESLGRLVVFSQIMSSSMNVVKGPTLSHGFTVIPLYQTQGKGRGGNTWLSPAGCAMFTMQLHIPLSSPLGQSLSLLQHIASLAIVSAICSIPGLQELDIGLKWPNDIYANKSVKIGGVLASSVISQGVAVCNIGCGFNLKNKEPTICLNDLIKGLNEVTRGSVPPLSFENYFAFTFNKLEELYDMVQAGRMDDLYSLYYNYWLHTDAEVKVKDGDVVKNVVIRGIDRFGFLTVETESGQQITVESDGNSFDMMQGLILPKVSSPQ